MKAVPLSKEACDYKRGIDLFPLLRLLIASSKWSIVYHQVQFFLNYLHLCVTVWTWFTQWFNKSTQQNTNQATDALMASFHTGGIFKMTAHLGGNPKNSSCWFTLTYVGEFDPTQHLFLLYILYYWHPPWHRTVSVHTPSRFGGFKVPRFHVFLLKNFLQLFIYNQNM